jgi:hypothetical protein
MFSHQPTHHAEESSDAVCPAAHPLAAALPTQALNSTEVHHADTTEAVGDVVVCRAFASLAEALPPAIAALVRHPQLSTGLSKEA